MSPTSSPPTTGTSGIIYGDSVFVKTRRNDPSDDGIPERETVNEDQLEFAGR